MRNYHLIQARLPAPVSALAVLDADTQEAGGCETIAAVTADGHLHFLRSVEDDLWEETLEVKTQVWP